MTRVAVVGHVEWVDFISLERFPREGEVVGARSSFSRAAGGGGVASAVLTELGATVDFFTALGTDAHGQAAAEQLRERGIDAHIAWREEPTRRALTLLEHAGDRTIVTVGARLEPAGRDPLPWENLERADGAYFTAGDLEALQLARRARVLVATPRARGPLEQGSVEIDALVFSEHDPDEVAWARAFESRARLVVQTAGTDGGSWRGESCGRWSAVAPPGELRDSYGSGDSFAAAFTFSLANGSSVQEAADLGARWGAECVTRAGAP